jgi:cytochrome c
LTLGLANGATNVDHAVIQKDKSKVDEIQGLYAKKHFNFGKKATKKQIAGWDIDVRPDGKGLPKGKGTIVEGEEIYNAKCAVCHGDFGEGVDRWPILAGGQGTLKHQRSNGNTEGPEKTVGSYWPYASTLWDYINRAMPFTAPQSLSADEVYALTIYVLYLNEIKINGKEIDENFVLTRKNFKDIKMPNEDNFYPKPGNYLTTIRPDTKNTKCMSNCVSKKRKTVEVLKGVTPLDPFKRKKFVETKSFGELEYVNKCAACHAHGVAGAPKLSDKSTWMKIMQAGKKTVYANAINGKGGMPPKGGHTSLSDKDIKKIVDYMIKVGTK